MSSTVEQAMAQLEVVKKAVEKAQLVLEQLPVISDQDAEELNTFAQEIPDLVSVIEDLTIEASEEGE